MPPHETDEHGIYEADTPSPAVLWIVGALGVLCVVSLVMGFVTTD